MASGFKLSVLFALVVSQIACVKLIITNQTTSDVNERNNKVLNYEISNNSVPTGAKGVFSTKFGSSCLKLDEGFGVSHEVSKDHLLNSNFMLTFNSGNYSPESEYSKEIANMSGSEFCVIWGLWLPSATNGNKVVQFYFNVLSDPKTFVGKYLFLIDLEEKKEELYVDLSLGFIRRTEDTQGPWFSGTLELIKTKCKDKSQSRNTIKLRYFEHNHKGDGNFSMSLLLNESDEQEINSFLEDRNTEKRLQQGSSGILGKMICSEKRFEFVDKSSGNTGIGFRVAI